MSKDVVLRKDVAFGSPEDKILHFDPIFLPKNGNFQSTFDMTENLGSKRAITGGLYQSRSLK